MSIPTESKAEGISGTVGDGASPPKAGSCVAWGPPQKPPGLAEQRFSRLIATSTKERSAKQIIAALILFIAVIPMVVNVLTPYLKLKEAFYAWLIT
jgi:hypothetical protein